MPVKRRVSKRKASVSAAEWQWMTGVSQPDANPFSLLMLNGLGVIRRTSVEDLERACEIWAQYRYDAIRAWTEHSPGTRPRPWWLFDAPSDAFRVVGTETDEAGIEFAITESEAAFLARHGLLTKAESRALTDEDFEPVGDDGPFAAEVLRRRQATEDRR